MAFSSQSFTAPKITKGNFSSPLSSGASKISAVAPKLNVSRIKFKPQSVSSPIIESQSSIENALVETNTILVEIQKQLALDFAMRITEEKEKNKVLKEEKSRKRLALKESAIESTKKIGNVVKSATGKILAPVKSVFDKILDFLLLLGGGIATNAVFNWLSEDQNKQKLTGWFNFIVEHWKWGLAALGAVAALNIIGPIATVVKVVGGAVGLLAKGIPFLLKGLGILASPLFLKVMLAIGAGVLAYKGGEFLLNKGRDLITGGENFSAAHSELDKQFQDAGLIASGPKAGKIMKRRGRSFTYEDPTDPETIALRDKLLKKRKDLFELKDQMNAEIKEKQSNLEPIPVPRGRKRQGYVNPNMKARREIDMQVRKSYDEKIQSIMLPEPRAMGGPVNSGSPYLVGEIGPELFIPKVNGSILNSAKTESVYRMISSKNAGKINFVTMDLPPIDMRQKKSVPTPPAPSVPVISPINASNPYMLKTPDIYGIYV